MSNTWYTHTHTHTQNTAIHLGVQGCAHIQHNDIHTDAFIHTCIYTQQHIHTWAHTHIHTQRYWLMQYRGPQRFYCRAVCVCVCVCVCQSHAVTVNRSELLQAPVLSKPFLATFLLHVTVSCWSRSENEMWKHCDIRNWLYEMKNEKTQETWAT